MVEIKIVRKIKLDSLGEVYKDSYIDINEPSINQALELRKDPNTVVDYFNNEFIAGKIWDGEKLVDITKEDVLELPLSILKKVADVFLEVASQS
jgi:hypothetical protein